MGGDLENALSLGFLLRAHYQCCAVAAIGHFYVYSSMCLDCCFSGSLREEI